MPTFALNTKSYINNMKEPILILVAIFIFLGFAWDSVTAPKEQRVNSGSSTISRQKEGSNQETTKDLKGIKREVDNLEEEVEGLIEKSKRSPYWGKIRMSNISGLRQSDPSREYFYLSTNLDNNETVNISGWYLKSEVTGYGAIIGQASLLPFPFNKSESDIILQKGDRVYVVKGFSPIGISFRTNKCTGYFEEDRTFVPSLPQQCPRIKDENLPTFSTNRDLNDRCLEIIDRIPRCQTRDSWYIHNLEDDIINSCKDYIREQVNYNTCVALHIGDLDFPDDQYRVYLNKFGPLWRERSDTINLHDQNDLIVDTIDW